MVRRPHDTRTKSVTKEEIMGTTTTTSIKPITLDFATMTNTIDTLIESEIIPVNAPLYYCSCETMNIVRLLDKYHLILESSEHYVTKDAWWQYPEAFEDLTNEAALYYSLNPQGPRHDVKFLWRTKKYFILFMVADNKIIKHLDFSINEYSYNIDNVFLDIETTGLGPLWDDIISIGLYQPSTGKTYTKLLPLEKQNDILPNITAINGLTKTDLQDATPLTQMDIDHLIEMFQLHINPLVIYTGRNLFDATFLNVYFHTHGLSDHSSFRFMNLRDAVTKSPVAKQCSSTSKDVVAQAYNIVLAESHRALGDCKIESAIAEYLFTNIMPRNYSAEYENIITQMLTSYDTMTIDEATNLYEELCNLCRLKNGEVNNDYDDSPRKRGGEGIDIHHIDETVLDDIAKRTVKAQEINDIVTLKALKPYNDKGRLVYATKTEHFLLHCLIEKIREGNGGGPHFLYGTLILSGVLRTWNGEKYRQIYLALLRFEHLHLQACRPFWSTNILENDIHSLEKVDTEFNLLTKYLEEPNEILH